MNTTQIQKLACEVKQVHKWLSDEQVLSLIKYCLDNCTIDNCSSSEELINRYVTDFLTLICVSDKAKVEDIIELEKEHRTTRSELAKIMRGGFIDKDSAHYKSVVGGTK